MTHLFSAILAAFSLSLTVPDVADDSERTLFDLAKPRRGSQSTTA
jgi:hypothetical protein